ncbi:MAG: hypothetical protein EXQ83_06050 [Xanthobacteraceae bacterium]|nr:hypothetical protein [Xanthobacteraceae bacterium]
MGKAAGQALWHTRKDEFFHQPTPIGVARIVRSSISNSVEWLRGRSAWSSRLIEEIFEISFLKQKLSMPVVKYGALTVASCL